MGKKGVKKKKKKKTKKATSSLLGDLGGIEVEVAEKVDKFVNCQLKLLSARVRRESRKDFRDRWPPAFECETCHKAFTTGHDYSLHMC